MPLELPCEVFITPPPGKLLVLPGGSVHLQSNCSIPVPPPVRDGEPAQMASGRHPTFLYLTPVEGSTGRVAHLVMSISLLPMDLPGHVSILKHYEGEDLLLSSSLVVTHTPITLTWTGGGIHQVRCSLSQKSQLPFHQHVPPPVGTSSWLQDTLLPRRVPGAIRVCSPSHFQLFALLT